MQKCHLAVPAGCHCVFIQQAHLLLCPVPRVGSAQGKVNEFRVINVTTKHQGQEAEEEHVPG